MGDLKPELPQLPTFFRPGCSLKIEPDLAVGKIRLLGPTFEDLFGSAPPSPRCQVAIGDAVFAWLAPGDWLVCGAQGTVASALRRVTGDLALGIDVTHGRVAFILSGKEARAAIAATCPLDTDDRVFPVGSVARSRLGDAGLFIARLPEDDGTPRFRLIVDQTMAAYAIRMLSEPRGSEILS